MTSRVRINAGRIRRQIARKVVGGQEKDLRDRCQHSSRCLPVRIGDRTLAASLFCNDAGPHVVSVHFVEDGRELIRHGLNDGRLSASVRPHEGDPGARRPHYAIDEVADPIPGGA